MKRLPRKIKKEIKKGGWMNYQVYLAKERHRADMEKLYEITFKPYPMVKNYDASKPTLTEMLKAGAVTPEINPKYVINATYEKSSEKV